MASTSDHNLEGNHFGVKVEMVENTDANVLFTAPIEHEVIYPNIGIQEEKNMEMSEIMIKFLNGENICEPSDIDAGNSPLHAAVRKNYYDVAEKLLRNGASVNQKNNASKTPLHLAVARNEKMVRLLINFGADLTACEKSGNTPLHSSIKHNIEMVDLLISLGADINAKSKIDEYSPLHEAVHKNRKDAVELLLLKGANVNARAKNGETPLHLALINPENEAIAYVLIANGAEINAKDFDGYSPLHHAIGGNQRDLVEFIVENGADINAVTEELWTPLHSAVYSGYEGIVKILFDAGADLTIKDKKGRTPAALSSILKLKNISNIFSRERAAVKQESKPPLHAAVYEGNEDLVKQLIQKGNDVNSKDSGGKTPLHLAVKLRFTNIINTLILSNADVNAQDNDGKSPLHLSTVDSISGLLISKGANIELKSKNGETPLHEASYRGNAEVIKILLDNKADIEAKENYNWTPLHLATKKEIAAVLLERGANANCKDKSGWSPLYYAAHNEKRGLVSLLLSHGADVEIKTDEGKTPLFAAVNKGHLEIIKILLDAGADINAKGSDRTTLIHEAAEEGHIDVIKFLQDKGLSIHEKNKDDLNSVCYALSGMELQTVMFLLREGVAFPNAKLVMRSFKTYQLSNDEIFTTPFCLFVMEVMKNISYLSNPQVYLSILDKFLDVVSKSDELIVPCWKALIKSKNGEFVTMVESLLLSDTAHANISSELGNTESSKKNDQPTEHCNGLYNSKSVGLWVLIYFINFLYKSSSNSESEKNELELIASKIELQIEELLHSDYFDDFSNVMKILFLKDEDINVGNVFNPEICILGYCLDNDIKILFNNIAVVSMVNRIFTHCPTEVYMHSKLFDIQSRPILFRFCPFYIYIIHLMSQALNLFIIGIVSVNEYGADYGLDYSPVQRDWSQFEILLAILLFSSLLHELGEFISEGFSVQNYFKDQWNVLDFLSASMGLIWFGSRFSTLHFATARVLLSLQAIPEAVGLLRYLSINQRMGELVILVQAMMFEMFPVIVLYVVSLIGVCIALRALFYDLPNFSSNTQSILSVLSITFSGYDFSQFITNNTIVNVIGVLILIAVLVSTAILLINLLIAQMTNVYSIIKLRSFREWSISKARALQQYLIVDDWNVLSMLPAPLNLVTIAFGALHYIPLLVMNNSSKNSVSVAGSLINILFEIIFGIPCEIYAQCNRVYIILTGNRTAGWKFKRHSQRFMSFFRVTENDQWKFVINDQVASGKLAEDLIYYNLSTIYPVNLYYPLIKDTNVNPSEDAVEDFKNIAKSVANSIKSSLASSQAMSDQLQGERNERQKQLEEKIKSLESSMAEILRHLKAMK